MKRFKQLALACATKKTYSSQLDTYIRFCIKFGFSPIPIDEDHLLLYTAFLANNLSASSIPGYLNIVRLTHLSMGFEDPLSKNFELQYLKRGILRDIGKPPRQKAPFTTTMLVKIKNILNFKNPKDISFWAIVLVSFYGMLRKSSTLPKSQTDSQKNKTILSSDVFIYNTYCAVRCRHSKTNQFGLRSLTLKYFKNKNIDICPYRAIMQMLQIHIPNRDDFFFSYKDVHSNKVIFWFQNTFAKYLTTSCLAAGISTDISAHSLRRGGASLAFKAGVSPLLIQAMGDWRTNCFKRYVFLEDQQISEGAMMMACYSE